MMAPIQIAVPALLGGLCLSFIFLLVSSSKKKRRIRITLEELSEIWTRYNDDFDDVSISNADILDGLYGEIDGRETESCNGSKPAEVVKKAETENSGEKKTPGSLDGEKPKEKESAGGSLDRASSFISRPVRDFLEECIIPHKNMIEQQKVADVVKELILLLDTHKDCGSVVTDKLDSEACDLISVRENLARMPLLEHSFSVTKNLIAVIKENYVDYEIHIPKAIIAGLAHDIGKIPELRSSNAYNTYEHPMISANKLMEMFAGKDIFWIRQVVKAVEDHHVYSKDNFTLMLVKADREARQMELLKFTSNYKIDHFKNWFMVEEFLKKIEPKVNHGQTYNKCEAFSFRDIIYCQPDFLYNLAKKYCRESNILDMNFIYDSNKQTALRLIVQALRQERLIPDFLGNNRFAMKVAIYYRSGANISMMVTPIRAPGIFDMNKLESRKKDYLTTVVRVTPALQGKSHEISLSHHAETFSRLRKE
jgi:hypothetical protein